MALARVRIGSVEVSRLAIGGNPFSGFSHQGAARDRQMRAYYTVDRIKAALRKAEAAGIDTFFGRADSHIMRMLEEYWAEGGRIRWFAQTAPEIEDVKGNIAAAARCGAAGAYVHGGVADYAISRGEIRPLVEALEHARSLGLLAGIAGHKLETHRWVRENVRPDFQLCCYYNPIPREESPHHVAGDSEIYDPRHRDAVVELIPSLAWPVVHYKVLAAGRTPAREAFAFAAKHVRPRDVVLVGFHLGDDEELIGRTVELFDAIVG